MMLFRRFLRLRRASRTAAAMAFSWALAAGAPGQTEAQLSFGNLSQQYTGTAKYPTVFTNPGGLNVTLELTPRTSTTTFSNIPSTVDLSYPSNPLSGYKAFGDIFQLGGTLRNLESVDVMLVNWAKASSWPALAASNPNGYPQAITIIVYQVAGSNLTVLTQKTQTVTIPWRPETLSDGSAYPWNGTAFKVRFNFPLGTTLSDNIALFVAYNNQTGGFTPTGESGPADSLNVALSSTNPTVGTNPDPRMLRYTSAPTLTSAYGAVSPMFEVRTIAASPPTAVPVNVGHYAIRATVTSSGYTGTATADMVITPIPATITLGNLKQAATGTPKSVSVTTSPAGLAHTVVYDGLTGPPTTIGKYPVTVEITAPNYQGRTTGTLILGKTFETFLEPWVTAGLTETGALQDPDKDGSPNLLEYAFGTSPTSGSEIASLKITRGTGKSLLTYTRQKDSIDLLYEVQSSPDLSSTSTWTTLTPTEEILSTLNGIDTVRASVDDNGNQRRFFRLKVTRITP